MTTRKLNNKFLWVIEENPQVRKDLQAFLESFVKYKDKAYKAREKRRLKYKK
jgi:hypothetical protein